MLNNIKQYVDKRGSIDFILHLAEFYNFDYKDKPEYYRTNVKGTKNILELARFLRIKRLIFASSLAACSFPVKGKMINEKSKADADYAYARTKRQGEEMLKEYSRYFNCTIVRFAAIFSDWCEYAPLYKFLATWISNKWDSRIIGGKGNSAISYLHINDLICIILKIIEKNRFIPSFDTYIASPDGSTSHKVLYKNSTKDYYGKNIHPLFIPKPIAYFGLLGKTFLRNIGILNKPFERLWMIQYIDQQLNIDNSYTRNILDWNPTPRYHLLRRLLFLLINFKGHHIEWKLRNEASLKKITQRSNLMIYENLFNNKEEILNNIKQIINIPENKTKFERSRMLKAFELMNMLSTYYNLLMASVRSGDRSLMIKYIDSISMDKYLCGFKALELCDILSLIKKMVKTKLEEEKGFRKFKQDIHDYIDLGILLAQDSIEDVYLEMNQKLPQDKILKVITEESIEKRDKLILRLSTPYQTIIDKDEDNKEFQKTENTKLNIFLQFNIS